MKTSLYNACGPRYTNPPSDSLFAMKRNCAMVVAQRFASDAAPGPQLVFYTTANDKSRASCPAKASLEAATFELSHADSPPVRTSSVTVIQANRCVYPPARAAAEVLQELDFCHEYLHRYYV